MLAGKDDIGYDDIPVHYCRECLSLRVMRIHERSDACFCDDCGSTDIASASFEEWEERYKDKYGDMFLNKDNKLWRKER